MENKSTEQFKIEIDRNNILHLKMGDLDSPDKLYDLESWAKKVKNTVIKLYKKTGKKILAVIDISELKKYSTESFSILTDLMKSNQQYVSKSATFGGDKYVIVAQDILLALSGRDNFKAFETEKEALDWLISDNNVFNEE
jgi:hypothetical protein